MKKSHTKEEIRKLLKEALVRNLKKQEEETEFYYDFFEIKDIISFKETNTGIRIHCKYKYKETTKLYEFANDIDVEAVLTVDKSGKITYLNIQKNQK